MRVISGRKTTAAWLMLALTFASVIAVQVADSSTLDRPATALVPMDLAIELPVVEDREPLSPAAIDQILARPLFVMSRRPIDDDADRPAKRPARRGVAESLTLVGLIHSDGAGVALLRHRERGMLRVREDQDVDGWRLASIDRDGIRLVRGQEAEWLGLKTPSLDMAAIGRGPAAPFADPGDGAREIAERSDD